MGDFFGGLRSGVQFPQVVMNQGPLPGSGGLPTPLHEQPDARINYNSSLLGNLQPYAYGEPGYLSSQNAYLNIPHKIQKIVPVVYLPEARKPAKDIFDLSHPIDDGDIAFVLRLDRNSMFCTGLKNGSMRRAGLGTAIDPFINLCTLNYILSGMQLGVTNDRDNLWTELLSNLDSSHFGGGGYPKRDYSQPEGFITLSDIVHVVKNCIRPFGVTRGSEKQGGQDEATLSPATWPVSFVVSLTIDGKESNVLNIWYNHDMSAGDDLVLRLKPMPIRPYTLNHYYKGVKRQSWDKVDTSKFIWQLVPDIMTLSMPSVKEMELWSSSVAALYSDHLKKFNIYPTERGLALHADMWWDMVWQEIGYWHIGRSQVMTGRYGTEEYWNNDLANSLRTNHLDITFQPGFSAIPFTTKSSRQFKPSSTSQKVSIPTEPSKWEPELRLESLRQLCRTEPRAPVFEQPAPTVSEPVVEAEPDWLGRLEFTEDPPPRLPVVPEEIAVEEAPALTKRPKVTKRQARQIGGSLLRLDGSSEPSEVNML